MTQTKTVHFGIFGQFFDLLYSSLYSFVYMAVNGRGFLMSQATPIVSPFSIELWHRAPFLFRLLQQILKITASEKEKAKKLPFNKYYFLPNKIVFNSQKIFIPKSSNDSDYLMCSDNSSSNIMSSLVNHEKNNAQFVSYKQDQTGSNKFKQDYAWHKRWLELLGMLLLVFRGGLWYKDFFKGGLISFFFIWLNILLKAAKSLSSTSFFRWRVLRIVIWHPFFLEIWAKVNKYLRLSNL